MQVQWAIRLGLILLAVLVWAAANFLGGDDETEPATQSQTVQ